MDFPLQTQCCEVRREWLLELEPSELFARIRQRGFNAVVIPVLSEGSVCFWADKSGELRGTGCHGRDALRAAHEAGLSVFLGVDFLSAGAVGSRRLGNLAAGHRNWLIRTSRGRHRVNQFPTLPGLFCWTAIDFRRFLSNLLVAIVEGHPVDGIVFDLRRIPRTTRDPRSWTHLGYSCLERIPRELGIDIEDFLNQPSSETLASIEEWRLHELHHFLSAMKARGQVVRQNLHVIGVIEAPPVENAFTPWLDPIRSGVLAELVVMDPDGHLRESLPTIDALDSDPVPLMLGAATEEALPAAIGKLATIGALGYMLLEPDLTVEETLPRAQIYWGIDCAVEMEPITAAQRLVLELALRFQSHEKLGPFFRQLEEFFRYSLGALKYEDAAKVRGDMVKVLRSLRQSGEFTELQPMVERAVRLLRLSPIASVEY